MTSEISLPLWLVVVLVSGFVWALFDHFLLPSFRLFVRRKVNQALDEVNSRLSISLKPFQLTKREVLIDRVVFDPEVLIAIEEFAESEHVARQQVQDKVRSYAEEIVPAFNAYMYFRVGQYLCKTLSRFLFRVKFGFVGDARLAEVDDDATVVFVMNHRSNMDYILVSYLVSKQSTLSYAVGEWAQVWPLQQLIRSLGAFFVRRNSGDRLYRKVLERYVAMATQEGVCQAVFPEGGLSRDGALRPPKLGFLDYMLRQYNTQNSRDIVFIPVGINYDRTIEDTNLLRDLEKNPKPRGVWNSLKLGWKFLWLNMRRSSKVRRKHFGFAAVNFGEPYSVKEFCQRNNVQFDVLEKSQRFVQVGILSEELLKQVAHAIPVLPVPLVCLAFNQLGAKQTYHPDEVFSEVRKLLLHLVAQGSPVREEEFPRRRTLQAALDSLTFRGIIVLTQGCYSINLQQQPLIDYYANSLAHWLDEQEQPVNKPLISDTALGS